MSITVTAGLPSIVRQVRLTVGDEIVGRRAGLPTALHAASGTRIFGEGSLGDAH
jgi:hypothetical protein